jgi:hypothetical protein
LQQEQLPAIQAAWQTVEQNAPPKHAGVGIIARGCSLRDLDAFFRGYIALFETPDVEQRFQDATSFTFRTSRGFFSSTTPRQTVFSLHCLLCSLPLVKSLMAL